MKCRSCLSQKPSNRRNISYGKQSSKRKKRHPEIQTLKLLTEIVIISRIWIERRCSFAPGRPPAGERVRARRGNADAHWPRGDHPPRSSRCRGDGSRNPRASGWDDIPSRSLHGEFFNQTRPGQFHPGYLIGSPGCLIGSVHLRALLDVGDTEAQSQGAQSTHSHTAVHLRALASVPLCSRRRKCSGLRAALPRNPKLNVSGSTASKRSLQIERR